MVIRLNRVRCSGFTLTELMITVAVIGILAAIAYPAYQEQVRRANRSAAQQFMLDAATREQQLMLDLRGYVGVTATANFPDAPSAASPGISLAVPAKASANYTFVLTVNNGASPPTFTVTATPINGSIQVVDGPLTLDHTGAKTPTSKW